MTESKTLIKKLSFRKICVTLSVFIIIYLTDSLLFATSTITYFTLARRVIPVMFAVAMLFCVKHFSLPFVAAVVSIMLSMTIYLVDNTGYFYISAVALLICGYGYSYLVSLEEFEAAFIKWMRIIAIVSLIAFWLGTTIKSLSFIPTITNSVDNEYKFLFLTNIPVSSSLSRRNLGPFWEPGVYQIYLNMALIFVFRRQGKTMLPDAILFVLTLLTTLSGASILPLPFILMAYLVNSLKNKSIKPYIAVFVILLVGVALLQTGAFDEILEKVFREDDGLSSGFRLGSAWANLVLALKYPFFGASPAIQDQLRGEIIQSINGVFTEGNTNTMLGYFSYFGIFVGSFFCYKIFGFCRRMSQNILGALCLFVAVFIMTSNENLILSTLPFVLMFLTPKKDTNKNEVQKL